MRRSQEQGGGEGETVLSGQRLPAGGRRAAALTGAASRMAVAATRNATPLTPRQQLPLALGGNMGPSLSVCGRGSRQGAL